MASARVAFITPGSFPIPSTRSSSVERVVEKFVPLLKPHVEPRIYGRTGKSLPRKGFVKDVVCERFNAKNKSTYIQSVGRALRRFSPQYIQVENRPQYVLSIRRRYPSARIWLNLHSSTFIGAKYISLSKLRRCFREADKIVVNSEFLRRTVAAKVPEAAHKLHVVYPGVDTARFSSRFSEEGAAKRAAERDKKGLNGRKVVIFMGRLIPLKGVHHLLKVIPKLVQAHPDLLVVIVGSPYYGSHRTTAYSRKLTRLGRKYQRHVRFVPYVPYSEVPNWFISADIAVVPSGQREAFGLVNVEAMASGLPVIATRAGGMKEIIKDGTTGYLIDEHRIETELKARLLQLLQDKSLRHQMGKESRERVERVFTWEHTAEQWLTILRGNGN